MPAPVLPLAGAVIHRLCGRPLVLFLDVDGTLAPIAPRPEYAVVPDSTKCIIQDIIALDNTAVVAISGRAADDTRRLLGVPGAWIIGNHGIEVAEPDGASRAVSGVEQFARSIAAARAKCDELATRDPGIIVEDKRWTLSIHYRLAHPRIVPALIADVTVIADEFGLRVTRGKEVLELRPPVKTDKGTAAVALAGQLGALGLGASVLCAGDDRTDEDAFTALRTANPLAVTILVGPESATARTAAEFCVNGTDEMRAVLESVLSLRRTGIC
jgi:trehalose-phosphatase